MNHGSLADMEPLAERARVYSRRARAWAIVGVLAVVASTGNLLWVLLITP